ncbi:MAG TPA: threonine/serine exporter family protein [Gemmataceae bacterium]|nr:threonine/serine exporter family protein [Gemmataceae bacterium]
MSAPRVQTDLLLQAGRLLLAYNESTGEIHRALTTTAKTLTDEPCHVAVSYRDVTVTLGREAPAVAPVRELSYNMAVQSRVHEILGQVRQGRLDATAALSRLGRVEAETPRHSRWLAALLLGVAAASLAGLLGADAAAAGIAGVATALGLLVRQELGRRHICLLALPLTAALIGAVLGGLAIRQGWTRSPELVLIVPALMLVPGPHVINGLLDLIDNQLPMSLSRLWLAAAILLASALGVVVGVELTVPDPLFPGQGAAADRLNLASDMALAGVATCGFAVFYSTPWRHLWMAAAGGMAGHGLRFVALEAGCRLEAATFLGGLMVGAVAAWMARWSRAPVAVIAFAGAVTMIPGLSFYRALAGALQIARLADRADQATAAATLGYAFQGCLTATALALGLILAARVVQAAARERYSLVSYYGGRNKPDCSSASLVQGSGRNEPD